MTVEKIEKSLSDYDLLKMGLDKLTVLVQKLRKVFW